MNHRDRIIFQSNAGGLRIVCRAERCEPLGAMLVRCYANGRLHNALMTDDADAAARAMAMEAAADLV